MKKIKKSRSKITPISPSKEEVDAMSPQEMDRPSESEASRYLDAFSDAEICAMTDEDYWRVCTGELQRSPAAPQLVPPGPRSRSLDRPKENDGGEDAEEGRSKRGGEAILAGHEAVRLRRSNSSWGDHRAAGLEAVAQAAIQVEPIEIGCGEAIRESDAFPSGLRDTLENPTMVAADASEHRSRLAARADVLEMAVDAAVTCGAQNSIEKMLAHQLALAHRISMHLGALALEQKNVESACKLQRASASAMRSYQQGTESLNRFRRGGRQIVTVQRVNINEGGKAVIAGRVNEPAA
jgi:hypothetical protein